jgi:hypothetical protein
MRSKACHTLILASVMAVTLASRAIADGTYCAHCGCVGAGKTCRLVCEEKKVEVTCWGCKCEDFCVPGPSSQGCRHCEVVCESCGECADADVPHAEATNFVWFEWMPGCAKTYTRTKLMKKTVTVTVPSHKWVVEELCPQCSAGCGAEVQPEAESLPPPTAAQDPWWRPAFLNKASSASATGSAL